MSTKLSRPIIKSTALDKWCRKTEKYEGELKAKDIKELIKLLRKHGTPS